jgi:hypothetical protein
MHRINNLLGDKINFVLRFEQKDKITSLQREDIEELKRKIFIHSDKVDSPFRKSIAEIFNSFYTSVIMFVKQKLKLDLPRSGLADNVIRPNKTKHCLKRKIV